MLPWELTGELLQQNKHFILPRQHRGGDSVRRCISFLKGCVLANVSHKCTASQITTLVMMDLGTELPGRRCYLGIQAQILCQQIITALPTGGLAGEFMQLTQDFYF